MSDILVVLKQSNKNPVTTNIPNDINYFEKILEGPVDINKFAYSGFRLICNVDDGYSIGEHGLPEGTYFIAKYDTDFVPMTVDEAEEIKKVLREKKNKSGKKRGLFSLFK
ncbi:hypothetical protein ACSVDE_14800 [Pseudalkalibacillus sp. Hm43]|uniref:hypothetical protein n=1 Tax=Pseudalkalibacillus sp. Hm43 TaxID=3450742 RepID=UPI003F4311A7